MKREVCLISTLFLGVFLFTQKKTDGQTPQDEDFSYLCRFVYEDNGKQIGESITIHDKDILIIKTKESFLGIPLKHIEQKEKILTVRGLLDLDKAKEMGEDWRKQSYQLMEEE